MSTAVCYDHHPSHGKTRFRKSSSQPVNDDAVTVEIRRYRKEHSGTVSETDGVLIHH